MKIIFTGDFLRPSEGGWRPTQHYNIRWLYDLFSPMLRQITHDDVSYICWNYSGVTNGQLKSEVISFFYDCCSASKNMTGWAKIYDLVHIPKIFEDYILSIFSNTLVIGFEVPPILKKIFLRNSVSYIDFIVHPVRFHDDIFFGIQTSSREANRYLQSVSLPEIEVFLAAGIVAATAGRSRIPEFENKTNILLLQTQYDKTQIRNGRFIGFTDYMSKAIDVGMFKSFLAIKPHPLDSKNPHALAALCLSKRITQTKENFYKLLSDETVGKIYSLSSSTCYEAKYFGVDSEFLYKQPFDITYQGQKYEFAYDSYVSIKDLYFDSRFWLDLLQNFSFLPLKNAIPYGKLANKPNRLRISLKSFWRFNEVDTDIFCDIAKSTQVNTTTGASSS